VRKSGDIQGYHKLARWISSFLQWLCGRVKTPRRTSTVLSLYLTPHTPAAVPSPVPRLPAAAHGAAQLGGWLPVCHRGPGQLRARLLLCLPQEGGPGGMLGASHHQGCFADEPGSLSQPCLSEAGKPSDRTRAGQQATLWIWLSHCL